MIRRSTAIAATAILLSLLVHFLGLSLTPPRQQEPSTAQDTSDVVALGNAFEDVAEAVSEPVQPEPAPVPEPPTEKPPEPESADTPTSEALVASSNPQRVFAPDTGAATAVTPETSGPVEAGKSKVPDRETVSPSEIDQGKPAEAAEIPPVDAPIGADTPKGNPDANTAPVAPLVAEPAQNTPVATAPQPPTVAAAPVVTVPVAPVPTVTSTPTLTVVPITPEESETVAAEPEETATVTPDEETDVSNLAVAVSPRPRLRVIPPTTTPLGATDGSTDYSDLKFPAPMESPLTTYRRDRNDQVIQQNGGSQSEALAFQSSRGPGNSDVTNYAGQVLVHLNRAPVVHVSAHGFARVFFEINPDGTLAWVDVIDSSGSPEIDRAAKAQIQAAEPFPRPPNGASRKLAFVYRIN